MDFFPTDVAIHIQGDEEAAFGLIPVARNMLRKAQLIKATSNSPVQLRNASPDGLVSVLLHGDLKIITITPVKTVTSSVEVDTNIFVLCGMIRDGTVYVDPDTGTRYLRSYRPTPATSAAHDIPNGFFDNERLCPPTGSNGSGTQYQQVKGCMYSGSMKRVVQAVQGLGNIEDKSPAYLTPTPAKRYVTVDYQSGQTATHGIVNAGPKNDWLVEISEERGVLAMPLPLIRSTANDSYRKYLARKGDIGGLYIFDEFGGLPSGETFPTGAALDAAITKGMVLRLLEPADLEPFFSVPDPTQDMTGFQSSWAFSLTTGKARATRILRTQFNAFPADGIGSGTGSKPSIVGEHWEIAISLSQYDLSAVGRSEPVGFGTASIEMLDSGRLSRYACNTLWVPESGELLTAMDLFEGDFIDHKVVDFPDDPTDGWGAVSWSYFDDDVPIILKWVPYFTLSEGTHYDFHFESEVDPDCGWDLVYQWISGYYSRILSPQGWVGTIDLRETDNLYEPFSEESTGITEFYTSCCTIPDDVCGALAGAVDTVQLHDRPVPGLSIWCGKFFNADITDLVHDVGSPTHPSPEIRGVLLWAMIPDFSREGHACARHDYTGDGDRHTIVESYIVGTGAVGLEASENWVTPNINDRIYFGSVVNGSKGYQAYCCTEGFQWVQPPPPNNPYLRVNLLAGEESTIPQFMNFIGDMRSS